MATASQRRQKSKPDLFTSRGAPDVLYERGSGEYSPRRAGCGGESSREEVWSRTHCIDLMCKKHPGLCSPPRPGSVRADASGYPEMTERHGSGHCLPQADGRELRKDEIDIDRIHKRHPGLSSPSQGGNSGGAGSPTSVRAGATGGWSEECEVLLQNAYAQLKQDPSADEQLPEWLCELKSLGFQSRRLQRAARSPSRDRAFEPGAGKMQASASQKSFSLDESAMLASSSAPRTLRPQARPSGPRSSLRGAPAKKESRTGACIKPTQSVTNVLSRKGKTLSSQASTAAPSSADVEDGSRAGGSSCSTPGPSESRPEPASSSVVWMQRELLGILDSHIHRPGGISKSPSGADMSSAAHRELLNILDAHIQRTATLSPADYATSRTAAGLSGAAILNAHV